MAETIRIAVCMLMIFSPAIVMLVQAKDVATKLVAVLICAISILGVAEFRELPINQQQVNNLYNYGEPIK